MAAPSTHTHTKGFFLDEDKLKQELGQIMPSSRGVDWESFIEKMRKRSETVIAGIEKEVLDVHPKKEAFVLRNVLTKEECDYLISATETIGYQKLHGHSSWYRSNTRRIIYYENLKNLLWERVHSFVTTKLSLKSNWNAYGLNPQFRFCRYTPGQKFTAHYDADFVLNSGNRSFYTFMIYLNGGFEGGSTRFLDPKTKRTIVSLDPEPGLLLVFQHDIYHDGEVLRSGTKYMMRSDVMFEVEAIDESTEEAILPEAQS